jgi:hypothetical protein
MKVKLYTINKLPKLSKSTYRNLSAQRLSERNVFTYGLCNDVANSVEWLYV